MSSEKIIKKPNYLSKFAGLGDKGYDPLGDDLNAKRSRSYSEYAKIPDYSRRKLSEKIEENEMKTIFDYAKVILEYNKLGPIAFITPELGRWSTMGGLGVMVDELSQGLVNLGEEIICISPYYEKNRKGETGYLEK